MTYLNESQFRRPSPRRGSAMLYSVVAFLPLLALITLVVDFGRIQAARSELQAATDAAARYAASGMLSVMQETSGATANAAASFAENQVDGYAFPFDSTRNLELGLWIPVTRTFVVAPVAGGANAVRMTTSLTLGTGNHPLPFLGIFGRTVTIKARSVAMITGQDASTYVSGKGNPWLAGVAAGGVSQNFRGNSGEWDYAGLGPNLASSPAMVSLAGLNVSSGGTITFDGVTGGANFGPVPVTANADGDAGLIINLGSPAFNDYTNFTSPMNGMSNCHAPISSVMAVFLSDSSPTTGPVPSPLDFATPASRDYLSIKPDLKQVFFVGDGRRANGEIQQIIVPPGATRLFIANMDGWQFNNNVGGYNLTIHANHKVTSVALR